MDFYDYYKANRKKAEDKASRIMITGKSEAKNSTMEIDHIGHVLCGIKKDDVTNLILMNDYMSFAFVSGKELHEQLCDKKLSHSRTRKSCRKTLAKNPYRETWQNWADKESLAKMSNEEILEHNISYALEELKEHGLTYMIWSIAHQKTLDKTFSESEKRADKLTK